MTGDPREALHEAETLFCSLHRVAATLCSDPAEARRPSDPESPHLVDLARFEARARQIDALRRLHSELEALTATVGRSEAAASACHRGEVEAMQGYLASAGSPWERSRRPPSPRIPAPAIEAPHPAPPPPLGGPGDDGAPPRGRIAITPRVSLDAVVIPEELEDPREIFGMVTTPELYYSPRWGHFAVRVGAVVLHGNLGEVYPPQRGRGRDCRARVRECRHGGACPGVGRGGEKGFCGYYHDPAEVAGSRDVRNFEASDWLPPCAAFQAAFASKGKRLGSRTTLEEDLLVATPRDARRQLAQTAHDLLCAVILAKYVL